MLSLLIISGCQTAEHAQQGQNSTKTINEVQKQLITLKLDELLPLEQTQRYGALFDLMTLPREQRSGRRVQFLRLSKCAETLLGPVTQTARNRMTFKQTANLYTVTLPVSRTQANVLEQWTFTVKADGSLAWNGLHWLTNRSDFLTCAAAIPGLTVRPAKKTDKTSAEAVSTTNASINKPVTNTPEVSTKRQPSHTVNRTAD